MVSLAAIALAGGQSSRMGQDKALLELNGIPLIQRTYHIAHQCADPVYVVTPWIEQYRDLLPPDCEFIQEIWQPGETKSHGPLVGFAQALPHVKTEWVLLLACDLPYLKLEVLQNWMYLRKRSPSSLRTPKAGGNRSVVFIVVIVYPN
jgi:molybdenum cofactor guanylyltransferase